MKAEQEKAEAAERKTLGMTTAAEDWKRAREMLKVRRQFFLCIRASSNLHRNSNQDL